ncbi:methyltransferase domain-containing protein [Candidatus Woesearchaeota archaeon]|nr:methyltransferase domain-containing protein [Candidatus Woesearchaeota archaeon]
MTKLIPYFGKLLPKKTKNFLKEKLHVLEIYVYFRKNYNILFKRRKVIKKFLAQKKQYLHIGCGLNQIKKKNWLNTDLFHGDIFLDITKKHPFKNNSLDVIFHEHVFEHISFDKKAIYSLKEAHRILKNGGVLRFAMPDFEVYAKEYLKGKLNFNQPEPIKYSQTRQMEILNQLFKQGGEHEFIYDYNATKFLLQKTGFKKIKKMSYNKSSVKNWNFDSWNKADTMYIEAIK